MKLIYLEIKKLLGQRDIRWDFNQREDVSILVGINGSGKTTILKVLEALLKGDSKNQVWKKIKSAELETTEGRISYLGNGQFKYSNEGTKKMSAKAFSIVDTFDVTKNGKNASKEQTLNSQLKVLMEDKFISYQLALYGMNKGVEDLNRKIRQAIDVFFNETGKVAYFADKKIEEEFSIKASTLYFKARTGDFFSFGELSSGEKQMLLILLTVVIQDETECVLLMDEPELSLHLNWQLKLLDSIKMLNPHCQIILATHSPAVFGDGWGKNVLDIEDDLTTSVY